MPKSGCRKQMDKGPGLSLRGLAGDQKRIRNATMDPTKIVRMYNQDIREQNTRQCILLIPGTRHNVRRARTVFRR